MRSKFAVTLRVFALELNRPALGLFLVFASLGCPHRVPVGPEKNVTDAAQLLALTDAAGGKVTSLQSDGKLTVKSAQGSGTLNVSVNAERPARIHLESFDFFNRPVAQLVCDGEHFGLYQANENRYYAGPASPSNLMRFTGVPLTPEALLSLLLGAPPRLATDDMTMTFDTPGDVYVVTLGRGARTQTLRIDPRTNRVVASEQQGYSAKFDDFRPLGSFVFPRHVVLKASELGTELDLRYSDPSANQPQAKDLFVPLPPEGVPVTHLGATVPGT